MTSKEHKEYLEALKNYSKSLLKKEADVKSFFVDAGIHTEMGNLKRVYSSSESTIGYKPQSNKTSKK